MRCLNGMLNHMGLFQANNSIRQQILAFVWIGDEDRSILISSCIEGQGSHNHKLVNTDQDFMSLSITYKKLRISKSVQFLCYFL